jgi:hypothetical protein
MLFKRSFIHRALFALAAVSVFTGYAFLVQAAAPSGGYTPGATLDPDCAPGDTDCIVQSSGGGISGGTDGQVALWDGPTSVTGESWFTYDSNNREVSAWESVSGLNVEFESQGGPDDLTIAGTYTGGSTLLVFIVALVGDLQVDYVNLVMNTNTGNTVTGGTSGATATIATKLDDFGYQTIFLRDITGTFQVGETVTDNGTGGTFEIDTLETLTADIFFWLDEDDSDPIGYAAITGSTQSIGDGLSVTFGSTAGHAYFDNWTISDGSSAFGMFISAELQLKSANGSTITFGAPVGLPSSYGLIFPDEQGTDGEALVNDGSGNLRWGASLIGATNATRVS